MSCSREAGVSGFALVGGVLFTLGAIKFGAGPLFALALGTLGATPPRETSPDHSWAGVRNILVVSQFTPGRTVIRGVDSDALCRRVQTIAAVGAPAPVRCTQLGDPKLGASGTAVLVFHAAISEPIPGKQLLLFTIRRADELGLEPAPRYFGSKPRAVAFSGSVDDPKLERSIRSSLGEILPWLNTFRLDQDLIETGEK